MYVVCNDDLDIAIDEFVEEYLQPPDVYMLDKVYFTNWESPDRCSFCGKKPIYLVV